MFRDAIQRIASEYPGAMGQEYAHHPLADFIRHDAVSELQPLISRNDGRFRCKGSAGAGNFAVIPWIAIFDELVTTSATVGYYVVYLFSTDGRVYLSLNQGTTAVRNEFGRRATSVLSDRASLMRARLPEYAPLLPAREIDLHSAATLPRDYEAGHAIGRAYDSNALPGDNELSADLHNCLSAYIALTFRGGLEPSLECLGEQDEEAPVLGDLREMRRYRLHRTIERNHKLAGMAKAILGSRCQACGFDFREFYGEVGTGFIEAHHLRPLSTLEEDVSVAVDPVTDFAVLCSNCHRIIHRLGTPGDLAGLRALITRH